MSSPGKDTTSTTARFLRLSLDGVGRAGGHRVAAGSSSALVSAPGGRSVGFGEAEAGVVIGRVSAEDGNWWLTNYTRDATFVVESLEGGGEFVRVRPRRRRVCVPFETSRLVLPLAGGTVAVTASFPPPDLVDPADEVDAYRDPAGPAQLDEAAKYFLVLVALCEPRLRNQPTTAVPTIPAVVERLRPLPGFHRVSRTAVNYHVDYLASTKLQDFLPAEAADSEVTGGKRLALVDAAVKYDLVRPEHLALLPAVARRRPSSATVTAGSRAPSGAAARSSRG